jgi:hypothetical protein
MRPCLARHGRHQTGIGLCIAALLLLVPVACGRKTSVRPPEAVAPHVIVDLRATNAAEGVRLEWARPRQTADGTSLLDLAGFRIERNAGGQGFGPIGRVDITDRARLRQARHFRFTDSIVNPGEQYQYRVISYTVDGYDSVPSNVVDILRELPTVGPPATRVTPPPAR